MWCNNNDHRSGLFFCCRTSHCVETRSPHRDAQLLLLRPTEAVCRMNDCSWEIRRCTIQNVGRLDTGRSMNSLVTGVVSWSRCIHVTGMSQAVYVCVFVSVSEHISRELHVRSSPPISIYTSVFTVHVETKTCTQTYKKSRKETQTNTHLTNN